MTKDKNNNNEIIMQKINVQNKKKKKKTLHFVIKKQIHCSFFTPPKHCNNKIENEEGE
jgi:hypothetical protein